jgi:hypothetical protein
MSAWHIGSVLSLRLHVSGVPATGARHSKTPHCSNNLLEGAGLVSRLGYHAPRRYAEVAPDAVAITLQLRDRGSVVLITATFASKLVRENVVRNL